ncbi:MAG: hypothetical protein M9945_14170 [Aquamicrobium sp.]|uniref:hypothetical protein n=1 Tax=Aquamicrobium sp. TaxID=1872579 RepID=UPI00349E6C1F|nr:hypothetical protein [Aquamicrobium sp.]
MLLASVKEIRDQLGFDDMTDINDAITQALHAVEPQIAARLDTSFARGTQSDTFYVGEPTVQAPGVNKTEFRLRRGLVQSIISVTATANSLLFSEAEQTDLTSIVLPDKDKGIVRDLKTAYHQQTVEIAYIYGFEDDDTSYDLGQVPKWLKESARILALIHLSSNPALTEAEVKLDVRMLSAQYEALMSKHVRYAPMALLPL